MNVKKIMGCIVLNALIGICPGIILGAAAGLIWLNMKSEPFAQAAEGKVEKLVLKTGLPEIGLCEITPEKKGWPCRIGEESGSWVCYPGHPWFCDTDADHKWPEPGPEICNGRDDDWDGLIDEGAADCTTLDHFFFSQRLLE